MIDSSGEIYRILHSSEPIAIVVYSDPGERDHLIELMKLLAPEGRTVLRTGRVEDVFQAEHFDSIQLLTPVDEAAAVATLDGRREALAGRNVPVVLFILRAGSADQSLKDSPALMSWVRGSVVEPGKLEQLDAAEERAAFERSAGQTPEAWLADWRSGKHADTQENNFRLHDALLMEKP